jgi:hypothetical protein
MVAGAHILSHRLAEFTALLDAAGYKLTRIIPTIAPQCVIEAIPS